jgi:hypothetical protein
MLERRPSIVAVLERYVSLHKSGHSFVVFDFTGGTHPISTKGTTQFSGAKRRSDLDCLQ